MCIYDGILVIVIFFNIMIYIMDGGNDLVVLKKVWNVVWFEGYEISNYIYFYSNGEVYSVQ